MLNNNLEDEILDNALEALKKNVTWPMQIYPQAPDLPLHYDTGVDRLLRILVQDRELNVYAKIKANLTNIPLVDAVIHLTGNIQLRHDLLIVTRYVTAQQADKLKERNIQFIDVAGNAYIDQAPLYIFVKGNKLPEHLRPIPAKRVFKPTGIKVAYAFLCNPDLVNKPYREIARIARVALGTVGWVMRDLKQMGFIVDMGKKGKRLVDRELLYHKWEVAYQEQLRPKLIIGRYQGEPGWWENRHLDPQIGQWGGEIAAARLTHYLKPETATVYLDRDYLNDFLLENRLRKDPDGNTEILERFWTPEINRPDEDIVHPLLIVTDLYETNDERNRETAQKINEEYIVRHLGKD